MAYEKRVCVIKQVKKGFSADGGALTGAVYAERFGDELTVTPRIAGLSPLRDGKYLLVLRADGQTLCLELRGSAPLRLDNAPSVKDGFAVLLCYFKGEAEPIAFGRCGTAPEKYAELLESVQSAKKAHCSHSDAAQSAADRNAERSAGARCSAAGCSSARRDAAACAGRERLSVVPTGGARRRAL